MVVFIIYIKSKDQMSNLKKCKFNSIIYVDEIYKQNNSICNAQVQV